MRVETKARQAKISGLRLIVMELQHERGIGISVSLIPDIRHIKST